MNFLAHLCLASGNSDLMLGGLFGDFIRGRRALRAFPEPVRQGIILHRYIDRRTDHSPLVKKLRTKFPREFRRYSGIIIDLAFDHELALNWWRYMPQSLERFDVETRDLIRDNAEMVPDGLTRFMRYADRNGLFTAYRDEDVILYALAGLGTRLSRSNPLHRVAEIWPELAQEFHGSFREFFPQIQSDVVDWCKRTSTTTGS
ncbi:MAG: ACP phosphodiesterase [Gammaproteobacteria bacterium]|nr:MAG: ACP phosphodiesterase [Gammaproteobacteria bacterium]